MSLIRPATKPITPAEAREAAGPSRERLSLLVGSVNEAIREAAASGRLLWLHASRVGSTRVERDAVVQVFKDAGWRVTFLDDQREGPHYQFDGGS